MPEDAHAVHDLRSIFLPGARLHLTHLSTAGSVELVRRAAGPGLVDVPPRPVAAQARSGIGGAPAPVSSMAVAPDGRLFVAVQANGQTFDPDAGTGEIRAYSGYAAADGSRLDEGSVWATIEERKG